MTRSGVAFGSSLAVVTIVFTGVILSLVGHDDESALQLASVLCTTVGVMLIAATYRSDRNAASPLLLSLFLLLIHFPFNALTFSDSWKVLSLLGAERFEYLTYSVLVCVYGMISMYIGFGRTSPGPIRRIIRRFDLDVDLRSRAVQTKLMVLAGVAVAAKAVTIANNGFLLISTSDQVSTLPGAYIFYLLASIFLWIGLFLLLSGLVNRVRIWTALGAGMVLFESAFGLFITGSRHLFAVPLLAGLLAVGIGYRPFRLSTIVALIATALFVLIPLSTAYKKALFSQVGEVQREGFSVGLITNALEKADEEDEDEAQTWDELVALRFHGATSLAVIIRFMPERAAYQWGLPYLLLPTDLLVPRFIWPDKPSIREFSIQFPTVFWNLERSSQTSVKTSMFGELWSNLRFFGVILGAFFFGRLLRFLYTGLRLGGGDALLGIAAAATILPNLILNSIEGELVTALANTMKVLIVWLIVVRYLGSPRKTGPGEMSNVGIGK